MIGESNMSDENEFIDEATLKKIKEHEEMMKSAKTNPAVDKIDEMEKMLSKCSGVIYELQEHFNTKSYLTDKQISMLKDISNVIDIRLGIISVIPEIKPEINKIVEGIGSDKDFLEKCLAKNPTSAFVKSIIEFYNKNGRITDKQREALVRTYGNGKNGKAGSKPIDTESEEYKSTNAFLLKCEETFPDSNFVKSVKEQFLSKGLITDRQRASLMKTLKEAENKIKIVDEIKISLDEIKISLDEVKVNKEEEKV